MHRLALVFAVLALAMAAPARAQDLSPAAADVVPASPPDGPAENPLPPELEAELHGTAGGMTSSRAAERAVRTAPSVDRARAAAQSAHAGAVRAVAAFFPRFDTSARYTRLSAITPPTFGTPLTPAQIAAAQGLISGVADPNAQLLFTNALTAQIAQGSFTFPVILDQYVLHAGMTWPVSDLFLTILPSYQASDALARTSDLQVESQRQTIAVQARDAFYSVARARGALMIARLGAQAAEAHQADVQAAVDAGVAAPVERMRIDAQAAAARVQLARAQGGVAIAEAALRTLLHMPASETAPNGEDLTAVPAPIEGELDVLLARALDGRPEVRAIRSVVAARDSLVGVRTGQLLPHLAVSANADYANPNQRIFPAQSVFTGTWDASLVLSWSPNDLFNATQDLDAAHGDAAAARADLAALEDGVRVEVTQSYEGYRSAREALESARLGEVASEEAYRVRRERYRAGVATTTELIDATTDLLAARLNYVNAAIDVHVADAHLRRAIGEDVTH